MIDLRSDTITRPDDVMRTAMTSVDVADNVLDGDPTIAALEERTATLLGMSAALWTPSGTMANLVALSVHLTRGDRFLAPAGAHVLNNELGSAAWFAGGMPEPLSHDAGPGRPTVGTVYEAAGPRDVPYFMLRTTLLCLENTHNASGGTILPPDEHARLVSAARDRGLTVHLDGARIWNAATTLGLPPAALTVGVDSVSACFSKGLGAPVGSVVAGSPEFITAARRVRHMLGGGIRQGGILAGACDHALDNITALTDDHTNASTLAAGLREQGWEVNDPDTNIVLANVADVNHSIQRLDDLGIKAVPMAGRVRFVTHRDVSADDIDEALRRMKTGG